jgi:hypothetical protein
MARGHGWSQAFTIWRACTSYFLPAFTGAFCEFIKYILDVPGKPQGFTVGYCVVEWSENSQKKAVPYGTASSSEYEVLSKEKPPDLMRE